MSEKTGSNDQKQSAQKKVRATERAPQEELASDLPAMQLVPGTSLADLPGESNADRIRQKAAAQSQRDSGNLAVLRMIQRQPAAPAAGSGKGKTFSWGEHTLSTDASAMRNLLEDIASKKGLKGAKGFVSEFSATVSDLEAREGASGASAGTSAPGGTSASVDDLEIMRPIRTTLRSEYDALETSAKQLMQDFEGQAKGTIFTMLQESENKLFKEAERYGLTGGFGSLNPFEVQTGAAVANTGNQELAEAAGKMLSLNNEIDQDIAERTKLYKPDDPFRLFLDKDKENELTSRINQKEEQANALVNQYPILSGYKDQGKRGQLAQMAKGGGEAALTIGPMIKETLENIKLVKGGLERDQLKIWSLPKVLQGTKMKMGFGPTTLGSKLVDEHAEQVQSDEMLVNLAIGALTIAIGLIASIPTAGAGGAAVAAGASTVSLGISTYQAASAIQEYQLAEAMTGTDPDKAKAISAEEPSMFWLALDIVGMIADVHGAYSAFKALAPQVRTVLSITEDFEKIDESLKSFKESCDAAKVPSLYERVVSRVRSVLEKNKDTIGDLKKIAQERYAGLSEAEKAEMLKAGISEEKFVEQMASNASRDIVISGAEGVRRTKMVTELMQPNNPKLAAVLAGDVKAMDRLLIEHGSWQQLMSQLSSGTPEMKSASQQLVERRATILKEIEKEFAAKPAGGASSEAVSDVDLIAEGEENAGQMMIKAEKYVQDKYGKGWSEALRMNFYTMAERLYMYGREMKGLSKEARAGVLADLSKKTDMYTVAKMLEYARGDPAAIKHAEAYAKTLGVDINSPELNRLLLIAHQPAVRIAERNKLLKRADELMQKYNALPPNASPQERMGLAKEISENQMRANFFTEEAYMGPGAAKMVVSQVNVVGFEAKMAVTSQLSMIAHEVSKYGGKVEIAMREYEIYKYINRFAAAARNAGSSNPRLEFFENLSAFIYKTERTGASTHVHLDDIPGKSAPKKGAPYLSENAPRVGEVSDDYLRGIYGDFTNFSHEIMREMDMLTSQNPGAWTPFNIPRPNSGPMKR